MTDLMFYNELSNFKFPELCQEEILNIYFVYKNLRPAYLTDFENDSEYEDKHSYKLNKLLNKYGLEAKEYPNSTFDIGIYIVKKNIKIYKYKNISDILGYVCNANECEERFNKKNAKTGFGYTVRYYVNNTNVITYVCSFYNKNKLKKTKLIIDRARKCLLNINLNFECKFVYDFRVIEYYGFDS